MDKIPVIHTKCPVCKKMTDLAYKPFCSKRCADVDLNRWMSGVYRIETNEAPEPSIPTPTENDE